MSTLYVASIQALVEPTDTTAGRFFQVIRPATFSLIDVIAMQFSAGCSGVIVSPGLARAVYAIHGETRSLSAIDLAS